MTDRSALEEVLHQVNNLLGTIEIQNEVARSLGTPDALTTALDHIVESARRTRERLRELRADGSA